jgi:hypothetical protein
LHLAEEANRLARARTAFARLIEILGPLADHHDYKPALMDLMQAMGR